MNLTRFVKKAVEAEVASLVERFAPSLVKDALSAAAASLTETLPVREVGRRLGYKDSLSACRRLGIPVVRITERKHVVRVAEYAAWLDGRTETAVKAMKGGRA